MDRVISIVNRANQRGGRMLSVIDLLEAGTLSAGQVAWLLERVLAGSSWLVGAKPGGAGKTTVMCALLAMLPARAMPRLAGSAGAADGAGGAGGAGAAGAAGAAGGLDGAGGASGSRAAAAAGSCLVAYELSPGFYEGYIWGADVRRFVRAGLNGWRIVANLHADTLSEARKLVAQECQAGEQGLAAFGLFIPLRLTGERLRRLPVVDRFHAWEGDRWREVERPDLEDYGGDGKRPIRGFLDHCRDRSLRRVEEVRGAWLSWCADSAGFS